MQPRITRIISTQITARGHTVTHVGSARVAPQYVCRKGCCEKCAHPGLEKIPLMKFPTSVSVGAEGGWSEGEGDCTPVHIHNPSHPTNLHPLKSTPLPFPIPVPHRRSHIYCSPLLPFLSVVRLSLMPFHFRVWCCRAELQVFLWRDCTIPGVCGGLSVSTVVLGRGFLDVVDS